MYPRMDKRYYATDLVTDILSGGGSSRLHQVLVKEKRLFSNVECYHFGSVDPGAVAIEGKLVKGVKMEVAEKALNEILDDMQQKAVAENELQKVKNKVESTIAFEDMSVMSRANSLAFYELMGDAGMMNHELEKYAAVTTEDILQESRNIFRETNCSTIYYLSRN